jgi:hypothetical protein
MSDLTSQALRELADHQALDIDAITLREAADRIEALEAENAEYARFWGQNLVPALAARDAMIAEALAALDPPRPNDPSEHADYVEGLEDGAAIKSERIRAILSRVPQGAAEQGDVETSAPVFYTSDGRVKPVDEPSDADLGAFDGAEAQFGPTIAAEPWTDPEPWVTPSGRVAHPLPGTWYASRPRSKAEFDADPDWADPTPWFRWCDSEMPDAPSWERYADKGNGTEFKPRVRSAFDAQNGAVRG